MTYEEIKNFIDEQIRETDNEQNLKKYRAEILAAITANDAEGNEHKTINESIELWKNQIGTPSELLLGTRYIVIKDTLLVFLRTAVTSGALEALISTSMNQGESVAGMSITIGANIVVGLIDIFQSVAKLEDYDFCVYMQATTHFKSHKEFTLDDLKEWLPHGNYLVCNMHNSKWDCEYHVENDSCVLSDEKHLSNALISLQKKKLLKHEHQAGNDMYCFKW